MKTITFDETQWQLVPKEPTRNMEYAASLLPDYFDIGDEYRAMLAAAPTLDVAMSNVEFSGTAKRSFDGSAGTQG